jgi:D-xylose 1-dehydrogenase (NADP+, D-xylono-1,5-lactone-forming)
VTVCWGIISTARINELILAGARKSDRVQIVAVGSRDRARAETYARAKGLERAYGSYEELLADPGIRAVYISLPNALHVEWSIRALRAGKHVLCEKPFTRKPEEVETAFDVAEREGRLLMEGFMWRHHPQVRRLQDLIVEGVIGELKLIRGAFSFTADDPRDIRLLTGPDGGSLLDVGCYCVHAARLLAGEPERVYGEAARNDAGVDVRFAGTMRFRSGVLAQFESGLDLPVREELEIIGGEASLRLPDPWHGLSPLIELHRGEAVEEITVESADSYGLELENLSDAVLGEAQPLLGRDDALQQARTLQALLASAEQGAPVGLC